MKLNEKHAIVFGNTCYKSWRLSHSLYMKHINKMNATDKNVNQVGQFCGEEGNYSISHVHQYFVSILYASQFRLIIVLIFLSQFYSIFQIVLNLGDVCFTNLFNSFPSIEKKNNTPLHHITCHSNHNAFLMLIIGQVLMTIRSFVYLQYF